MARNCRRERRRRQRNRRTHLRNALNKIFAPDLDGKMIAEMPDYWQYFYQAQDSHKWLEPTDQTLVHPGPGVSGPKILKNVVPARMTTRKRAKWRAWRATR